KNLLVGCPGAKNNACADVTNAPLMGNYISLDSTNLTLVYVASAPDASFYPVDSKTYPATYLLQATPGTGNYTCKLQVTSVLAAPATSAKFVIDDLQYPSHVTTGTASQFVVSIKNIGSAPGTATSKASCVASDDASVIWNSNATAGQPINIGEKYADTILISTNALSATHVFSCVVSVYNGSGAGAPLNDSRTVFINVVAPQTTSVPELPVSLGLLVGVLAVAWILYSKPN
ncbi:MAG: hypothetical protein Q7R47_05335, partial [Candidatus Diapherotrites archaeon]|nr:hypothetical protein [Candidatus Diapherotrites archaeon]